MSKSQCNTFICGHEDFFDFLCVILNMCIEHSIHTFIYRTANEQQESLIAWT
jgi:hypothetical protein